MTRLIKTFPVKLAAPKDIIILETRAAVADALRRRTARKIADGLAAGIDIFTISQRHNVLISQALQSSRLLRGVANSVVGWAINSEFARAQNNSESIPAMTIGGGKECVTILENYTCVISMSSIVAAGQADHLPDMPIVEVRLTVQQEPDGRDVVLASIVFESESNGGGASADTPQPVADVDA